MPTPQQGWKADSSCHTSNILRQPEMYITEQSHADKQDTSTTAMQLRKGRLHVVQNNTKPNNVCINAHFNNTRRKISWVEPSLPCPRSWRTQGSNKGKGPQKVSSAQLSASRKHRFGITERTSPPTVFRSSLARQCLKSTVAKAAWKRQEIKREMLCQHLELFFNTQLMITNSNKPNRSKTKNAYANSALLICW